MSRPAKSPVSAKSTNVATWARRVAGSARTAAIPPCGMASTIDGVTRTPPALAAARNAAASSTAVYWLTTTEVAPVVSYQNGDTSCSADALVVSDATEVSSAQYGAHACSGMSIAGRGGGPASSVVAQTPTPTAPISAATPMTAVRLTSGRSALDRRRDISDRRYGTSTSRSEPIRVWLAASGTSTTCGTAITTHPAAVADLTPVGESSIAMQSRVRTPSARAAVRKGSGCGLPLATSSPAITSVNESGGSASTTASANRRHDMVTNAVGMPAALIRASSSRAPGRHGIRV